MVLDTEKANNQHDQQPLATVKEHEPQAPQLTENQHDEADEQQPHPKTRSGSYRILGTFPSFASDANESKDDDDDDEEEDPMAWADLEAFGGTKKTLEKTTKKPRALSATEVREQLEELRELDHKMEQARLETKSSGMLDTIAWLQKHHRDHTPKLAVKDDRHRLKRSTSFVRSVLGFFGSGTSTKQDQQDQQEQDQQEQENDEELLTYLEAPWGQEALHVASWTQVGFALLNRGVLEDIARIQRVLESGELGSASPQAIIALSKWLWLFDHHVDHVATLKQYLLEERTLLAGVGYNVVTNYDSYKDAFRVALSKTHGDRTDLTSAILEMFSQLQEILKDEELAVAETVEASLTQPKEYQALSTLFHNLANDEECFVVVAKLVGFMKNHMDDQETNAFLALFDTQTKDKLAGEWMRHYASYLQLLDDFSVDFESSKAFFT